MYNYCRLKVKKKNPKPKREDSGAFYSSLYIWKWTTANSQVMTLKWSTVRSRVGQDILSLWKCLWMIGKTQEQWSSTLRSHLYHPGKSANLGGWGSLETTFREDGKLNSLTHCISFQIQVGGSGRANAHAIRIGTAFGPRMRNCSSSTEMMERHCYWRKGNSEGQEGPLSACYP